MKTTRFVSLLFLLLAFSFQLFAQGKEVSAADRGMASEDFRRGVISYYRGAYGDAILQFEKALSYVPDDGRTLEWLGKSYLKFGIESSALDQWKFAMNYNQGGIFLQNKYEIIQNRRVANELFSKNTRYVVGTSFPGVIDKTLRFSQIYSILPLKDGSFWATAYGSNELLRFDVNGNIIERIRGPLNGFDRPMDIIQLRDGNMAITEAFGDRVSVLDSNGNYLFSFGEKGIGPGQLLGPQSLAQNENGNIYVSDFGNKRVSVFTEKGDFLFSFNHKMSGPTGIAITNSKVYVADGVKGGITCYDYSGNYLGQFCKNGIFDNPECLRVYGNSILVADNNRIYSVDLENSKVFETVKIGNSPSKLTCACLDANGNMIASDFNENEVNVLSRMNELVGGLYVDILRVNADAFPNVTIDVAVQNRYRKDLIGLKENNFFLTETGASVSDFKYLGMVGLNQKSDITLIIDYEKGIESYNKEIETAVREIAKNMDSSSTLSIITAGEIPLIEYSGSPVGCRKFSTAKLNAKSSNSNSVELAFRLAANNLISNSSKKAIILLSDGDIDEASFTRYPISEICAYLANNSINFSSILLNDSKPGYAINYLESNLNGKTYFVYQSQGLSDVVKDLDSINPGIYRFSYVSALNSDYGRSYLPVEMKIYLHNRSGKDIESYFAPLE
ncbi:MAG: NHL repeat-containing protein [Treponemataceae bacterium]|nr:NHL repeat-containing protein [Treponemataceae bacterium]